MKDLGAAAVYPTSAPPPPGWQGKITFSNDTSTCRFMLSIFPELKKECVYCHKKITTKNLGAITKKGYMCKNFVCVIEFMNKETSV